MDAFKNTRFLKISQSQFEGQWVDYDEITFSQTFKGLVRVWDWTKFKKQNYISGRVRYYVRNHEATKGVWLDDFKNGQPVIIYVPIPDKDMPIPVAANEVEPIVQELVQAEQEEQKEDDTDWEKSFYNLTEWVDGFIKEHTDLILELAEFKKAQSKETKTSP